MTAKADGVGRRLPNEPGVVTGGIEMHCDCCRRLVLRAYGEAFIERQAAAVCRDCAKHITAFRPEECEFADAGVSTTTADSEEGS